MSPRTPEYLLVAPRDGKADTVAAVSGGPIDPWRSAHDPAAVSSLSRRGRGYPTVLESHA